MKKILLVISVIFVYNATAQVGIGTTLPNGQLDIVSTTRGILIPRVDLTSLTVAAPVTNPQSATLATSTMVYHNGTNNIVAGYYYWDGSKWLGIGKASEEKGLQYYLFTGTPGTTPVTEKSAINYTIAGSGVCTTTLDTAALDVIRGVNNDNFMILLTGTLVVESTGVFQLQSYADDGTRIIIDDIPVLNNWTNQAAANVNGSRVRLAKGKHKIEFWYYENTGGQEMNFTWLQNANGTTGVVNASSFIIE